MRKVWMLLVAIVAAIPGQRSASGAGDFSKVLKPTQEALGAGKKAAKEWFKSGKFPPAASLETVTKAGEAVVKAFVDGCPFHDKISFSDASHYADTKALKDWKLATEVPPDAGGSTSTPARFLATWSAEAHSAAPDVVVTICEFQQRTYVSGSIQERATKFDGLGRDVKNAQVADLLQAFADDWARTRPGAAVTKAAKKAVGVAKWFASVTATAADSSEVARRDWFAWETPGVSITVQGTTWIATVSFSNVAAVDAKATTKPEQLFKNLAIVVQ